MILHRRSMENKVNPTYTHRASIKTNNGIPDTWFLGKFSLSPYQGCQHGCLYCDGRAEKYYVEGDFERDIVIRPNLPQGIRRFIKGIREKGFFMIGSGISDAYQPLEKREKIMPRLLETFRDFRSPVILLTKSVLPIRDIDLFDEINKLSRFILLVTITTPDDKVAAEFEPGAASVTEKLDMVEAFSSRGIPVGIMMMPLLPGISDSSEDIRTLVKAVKKRGAVCVMPGGLTLRPGRQKDLYMNRIRESHPELVQEYISMYAENRASGAPVAPYNTDLYRRVYNILMDEKLPTRIPHRYFRGHLPLYDEVYAVLSHLFELYPPWETQRLRPAFREYEKWLKLARKDFSRQRSQTYHYLESRLRNSIYSGRMEERIANPRLMDFMRNILDSPGYFDYTERRWIRDD